MQSPTSYNYLGPYISDGRIQESVEFGEVEPINELDALARLHDSAYAKYPDIVHRREADRIFYEEATKLPGYLAKVAANAVLYGNHTVRSAAVLADLSRFGPAGWAVAVIRNASLLQADLTGASKKYRKDVLDYYLTDPRKIRTTQPPPGLPPQFVPGQVPYDPEAGIGTQFQHRVEALYTPYTDVAEQGDDDLVYFPNYGCVAKRLRKRKKGRGNRVLSSAQ